MLRRSNRSASASSTWWAFIERRTSIAMYSSSTARSFSGRPSCVRVLTKSYDQTWPAYNGLSRMHDPSLSHRRPHFG